MKIVLTRDEVLEILKKAIWERYDDAFIHEYEKRKAITKDDLVNAVEIVNQCSVILTNDDWEFSVKSLEEVEK